MAALWLLARSVLAAAAGGAAFAGAQQALTGDVGPDLGGFAGLRFLGGDGKSRRRRRRRALTASDKADIAFISGTLGKPAGRDFAMVVAARS